jgi:hypothetical protein
MPRRLTLVAGSGALARLVAEASRRNGDALQVIDVVGRGDLAGDDVQQIPLRQISELLAAVKDFRPTHLVLAGAVHLSDADRERLNEAAGLVGRLVRSLGDVGLSAVLGVYCRLNRMRLVGAHEIAPEVLAGEGLIAGPALDARLMAHVRCALAGARTIGGIDLGQSIVYAGSRPVAAEDAAGTDELLLRVGQLRAAGLTGNGKAPLILAKALKPKQSRLTDLPAIGAQTIVNAAASGIEIIAVEAGRSLVLEREELVREADARKISVIGVRLG